jgi:hypothetical protein
VKCEHEPFGKANHPECHTRENCSWQVQEAGIQEFFHLISFWIPASTGMTEKR